MRRVLIVSPHFPPVNAPDHQRVRMSLPYFRACGWEPVVLAVAAACVPGLPDPLLAATLPPDIAVHRVGAWPLRWTRLLGLGNIAYRAWTSLRRTGDRLLAHQKFDLVYFSTTQFVVTALGTRWLERFDVPFVVDIQDPWRTDFYERPGAPRPPGGWKYRFARWQAARLEERCWRNAAGFISVTDAYLTQLRDRYSWFAKKPADVIPFGASEADFEFARARADLSPAFVREPGAVHVVSVGAIGPIMRASLSQLFACVRRLRDHEPSTTARLRFHFIGTSYAPGVSAEPSVRPIAADFGLDDLVREQTARTGYFSAIKTLLAADAIVIPGSADPNYNPSKLATCFLAEKPVLALAPSGSLFEHMAQEFHFTTAGSEEDSPGAPAIMAFFRALQTPSRSSPPVTADFTRIGAVHSARARTAQQCALFDRAVAIRTCADNMA